MTDAGHPSCAQGAEQVWTFFVVQELFMTETAQHGRRRTCPAMSYAEKDGTFSNTERRVQRVRKAVDRAGQGSVFSDPVQTWISWHRSDAPHGHIRSLKLSAGGDSSTKSAALTPSFRGMSHCPARQCGSRRQSVSSWPCPSAGPPGNADSSMRGKFTRGSGLALSHRSMFAVGRAAGRGQLPAATCSTGRILVSLQRPAP